MSDSVTPWLQPTQALLSLGFPRQEHCNGLPFPPTRDLPDPGIEPASPALAGGFFTTSATWETQLQKDSSTYGSFLSPFQILE